MKRVRVKVRVKRKPAKPPVKLSKQLAKVRDAIRRGRGVPMSGDVGSIVIIGERDGYGWLVENQRTGKRVSKHKTFKAAWASRLKALKAERSTIAHELTHGRTPYHNEDPD